MDRSDAATFVGERYGQYLLAVTRDATDTVGDLKSVIDDAFRALGYVAADIPTATTDGEEADEDLRVQVAYRAMQQIVRDLGATSFDYSDPDGSYKLSQLRAAAVVDLAEAKDAVLERFGTLGIVPADGSSPFISLDLNYLDDSCEVAWR